MATTKDMVTMLKVALESNVGVKSINVDGQTIMFNDRMAILKELDYWETKAAKASGRRRMFRSINLGTL